MIYIAPSLLSADMARLAEAIVMVSAAADYIHCDIMDNHFVPNLTFGAPVVKAIKKDSLLPMDVHLMIESPGRWIKDFISAGLDECDFLTFHAEADPDPSQTISAIRDAGIRPGLAVKPETGISDLFELFKYVDQVLIMTVEPGFGGQSFIHEMMSKVREIRRAFPSIVIGIDGGIDVETAPVAVSAGADLLVAGSAVYGQNDPVVAIRAIRHAVGDYKRENS